MGEGDFARGDVLSIGILNAEKVIRVIHSIELEEIREGFPCAIIIDVAEVEFWADVGTASESGRHSRLRCSRDKVSGWDEMSLAEPSHTMFVWFYRGDRGLLAIFYG